MQRAFSLIELSIVLVILGLLTGGILAGQSLIRASELRSVGTEYQRFFTAGQAFRDKYFAVPGDFRDATKVWGRLNGNADCVTNSSTSVGSPGACDGDGGGTVAWPAAALQSGENQQFWRQLTLAGLIEGNYSGLAGSGSANDMNPLGSVGPRSKLNNAGWYAESLGTYGDNANFLLNYGNTFEFGSASATGGPWLAALKPEEAWNIDTKLDDGKPASGKVIGIWWNNACSAADDGSSANNDLVASYRLSDTSLQCALRFRNVF